MRRIPTLLIGLLAGLNVQAQTSCNTTAIYNNDTSNAVCIDTAGAVRYVYSNNYPDHSDNYNQPQFSVTAGDYEYNMCAYPELDTASTPLYEETETTVGCTWTYTFGVSINGVKYDPNSAVTWTDTTTGQSNLDWHVEATSTSNNIGQNMGTLNGGHMNPFGEYHYHAVPWDYFQTTLGIDGSAHSSIVGWAADGFPIYYKYVFSDPNDTSSSIISLSSGYSLKSGTRPGNGVSAPDGAYDGNYYEDYEYSTTTLDECNGRYGVTPDYPYGTYYYVLTDNYPYIPRCFYGTNVDNTFRIGPGPSCPASTASQNCAQPVYGCMDPFSSNYNPSANVDDGSCTYPTCDTYNSISVGQCSSYTSPSGNYTWTTTGSYSDTLPNSSGCDSIISINLTIYGATTGTDVVTACSTYTWIDGNTYYTSNNSATYTLQTSQGCDSVVTLDLSIVTSVTGTDVVSTCGSYTWIDGNTYTSSNNSATYTLQSSQGCDSIVTLNLTIGTSVSGTDVVSACGSYTWIDGNTYTSSNNTATHTISGGSVNGCDSVVTLNLTINALPDNSVTNNDPILQANASGATYQWLDCDNNFFALPNATQQQFEPPFNGSYAVMITQNGCSDTSACISVTTVGLDETALPSQTTVFPNPTDGKVTIDFGKTVGTAEIVIRSVNGTLILSKHVEGSKSVMLQLETAPGVYFIEVQKDGTEQEVIKLVLR